jgi:hypothetical protein
MASAADTSLQELVTLSGDMVNNKRICESFQTFLEQHLQ